MSGSKKLKVAFLWHMHQPYYLNPESERFAMPWVRLHALKDYLDMPQMAANYHIKATFNLVPSLLDQIDMYTKGFVDRHLELTKIPARDLNHQEKSEILETFFSANFPTMIEPHTRYCQLFRKKETCGANRDLAVTIYSTSEWRDLQVWSNLTWIDPSFKDESPVRELLAKGRDYTEADKSDLVNYQLKLLGKIIPTYRKLYKSGQIDISFTPYYHPILPLLIDHECAREAIPDIELPQNRFSYPEDAEWHLKSSVNQFKELFDSDLKGLWPSEGSVSEAVLKMTEQYNLNWVATDEGVLRQSYIKSKMATDSLSPHFPYCFNEVPGTKIFFRDHGLSDKIGFVYSGWEAGRAVNDFIGNLVRLKELLAGDIDKCVVPVILDGENAWEFYPNDGHDFLAGLYSQLAAHKDIEIVSFNEAAERLPAREIPRLAAGSWINNNFKIWIGHREDNAAWDLLYEARKKLTEFIESNPSIDKEIIERAWKQIYIAEGSDWCWWYGDEHIGSHNQEFDELFRLHLTSVYKMIKADIPDNLKKPIHHGQTESFVTRPESLITPQLDGLITHFYEWSGAGSYDCSKAGGAMHRVKIMTRSVLFAYDYRNLYIRLDFDNSFSLVSGEKITVLFDFDPAGKFEIPLVQGEKNSYNNIEACFNSILETSIEREQLIEKGTGEISFYIYLMSGGAVLEKWPIDTPIVVNLPEKDKEIFWQV